MEGNMQHGFLSGVGQVHGARSAGEASTSQSGQPYDRLFDEPDNPYPKDRTGKTLTETQVFDALRMIAEARRGAKDNPPPDLPRADESQEKSSDDPEDGIDDSDGLREETPAGYTYLGQFIIHDLTRSQFPVKGGAPINRVTARLDLDTVYGGGPALCPHFFQRPTKEKDGPHLLYVGRTAKAQQPENSDVPNNQPVDLPRVGPGTSGVFGASDSKAVSPLIPDIRNDENLIISQIHGLFVRVHNRVAAFLHKEQKLDGGESFRGAQAFVTECYRQIVVHDYLARLLPTKFYKEVISDRPTLIRNDFGPIFLEFAFSAARVCHAMSRQHYIVNSLIKPEISSLRTLLEFSSHRLDPPLPLPSDWVINWENFFQMPNAAPPLAARRLTPLLSPVLVDAETTLTDQAPHDTVSFRDLWRCYDQRLPTGQACADELIKKQQLINAQQPPGDQQPANTPLTGVGLTAMMGARIAPGDHLAAFQFIKPLTEVLGMAGMEWFTAETPLTYYLAQEAYRRGNTGRTFGPVGAYIMASTFRRALNVPAAGGGPNAAPGPFPYKAPHGVSTMPQFIALLSLPEKALKEQIEATMSEPSKP
jgi:hypothetical protein